jgi:hypothetical protein
VAVAQLVLVRRMQPWNNALLFGALSAVAIALMQVMLRRRMQLWSRAVLFGALSAALIVLIYATPPYEDSHFGGANFGYNFSFFFPALLSSFLFWVVALAFYIGFLRRPAGRSPSKIILPPVLLLPFAVQVSWMIALVVMVKSSV